MTQLIVGASLTALVIIGYFITAIMVTTYLRNRQHHHENEAGHYDP